MLLFFILCTKVRFLDTLDHLAHFLSSVQFIRREKMKDLGRFFESRIAERDLIDLLKFDPPVGEWNDSNLVNLVDAFVQSIESSDNRQPVLYIKVFYEIALSDRFQKKLITCVAQAIITIMQIYNDKSLPIL